jgi:hypothetical protein
MRLQKNAEGGKVLIARYVTFCASLYVAVRISGYIASNGNMTDELEMIWSKAVTALSEHYLLALTKDSHNKPP